MPIDTSLPDLQTDTATSDIPAARRSDSEADEISVLDLLIVFAEHKRSIFVVTTAVVIVSIVVSLLLPQRYTAMVTLLPPQQTSSMSATLASTIGNLGGMGMAQLAGSSLGIKNPNDMYVAMLKSRTVEDGMVQRFGLMQQYQTRYLSDARKEFEHRVTVDGNGKDGLIHISVEDGNPNRAAELANGYVDQYRRLSEHLAITEASQRRLFFEQQLERSKDNLADAEEALKVTQQKTGLIQLDGQARALIEAAASLRAQIALKEVQVEGMQTYATGENSQLIQARSELQGLQAQLGKLGDSADNAAEIIVPKSKVPEAGLEYVRKLRDVKYYETVFDILARQYEAAKLDEAREGASIQVVDAAVPPDKRSFPKRGIIVIVGVFGGLILGILFALLQAGMKRAKAEPLLRAKFALLRHLSFAK